MALGIIKILNKYYYQYIDDECLDIVQIKNICNLYKIKKNINSNDSISFSDIKFSSPDFVKHNYNNAQTQTKKTQFDLLKTDEFYKKYAFFIKILYACLKINIELFDINNNILTLKNNYQLLKTLELKKK